jgi:hypothetical protein
MDPTTKSPDGSDSRKRLLERLLWLGVGYYLLSLLTIPFVGRVWWGELPVLAVFQFPKLAIAGWLRTHVVMEALPWLGLSRGSFSPDYLLAGPYALAMVYLLPMIVAAAVGFRGVDKRRRLATVAFLIAAVADYAFILLFASGRFITIY